MSYIGKQIALLGAGFSRNWGGWLAAEAFEYLLGCPQVDPSLRDLLWKYRRTEGFEGALGELQTEHIRSPTPASRGRLRQLEDAIAQMFSAMDAGFATAQFEFQNDDRYLLRTLLRRFDAIFTLNQDLLLERHYLNSNVMLGNPRRWNGWQMLGMRPENTQPVHLIGGPGYENTGVWLPGGHPAIEAGLQPYVKLHGSTNWRGTNDTRIVVMGAYKKNLIDYFPVLSKLHQAFQEHLMSGPVRLMVIGYSFADDHINEMLTAAAATGNLSLFVVDPLGIDVLDKNRNAPIYSPGPLMQQLGPSVVGASRRTLREIFGSDHAEHGKVAAFLK